jgi:2-haloacid dehalogenase
VVARAIVFDVMGTLIDLAPVRRRLSELGAPEGALEAWFGRMLHSAASLTLVGEFHSLREIGRTTLLTTLAQLDVEPDQADEVLRALGQLDPYPDASQAFGLLEEAGVPAVTLTNGGRQQPEMLLESAGLRSRVPQVLTVDEVGAFSRTQSRTSTFARCGADAHRSARVGRGGRARGRTVSHLVAIPEVDARLR